MSQFVTLPIPNSWYAVAFSSELKPGTVLSRTLAEHELVIFRTRSGRLSVMDAYCPHLGAHMGIGGTVEGETIRCPFHAFRFDTGGVCVATSYGTKPPPAARAKVWPLREVNGILFVYYDSRGEAPTWEPPALDCEHWTTPRFAVLDIHDHPQETVENGVDIGHFAVVHGYDAVNVRKDLQIEGPHFHVSYAARRPMPYLGALGAKVDFDFALDIYGLGFSLVNVTVSKYGAQARLFILARPTVKDRIDLGLALSLKKIDDPGKVHPLARLVPRQVLTNLIARGIHQSLIHDTKQDLVIWEHKRYIHPPALAEGDGPIGKYRIWARQFYHESPLPTGEPSTGAEVIAAKHGSTRGGDTLP